MHQAVGCLTARRLIPLITLVVKDYQVELDTPLTYERARHLQDTLTLARPYSGRQQIQSINLSAETGRGYYKWALSPFITRSAKLSTEIDELPKRQYRLTQITELLDNVGYLVQHHATFLQNKIFQTFLLKCLRKVKEDYASLEQYIDKVDSYLAHDEHMSRNLQAILCPLTRDLNRSLESFSLAANNIERIVSSPDFTEQQWQLLATNISAAAEQFTALFAEESGISALVDLPSTSKVVDAPIPIPERIADVQKVIALRKLAQRCYNALSYQSREGHKGLILRELLHLIEEKTNFSEGQIKHIIMELTRVTASYRETWLFQASYGQTRSARALIAAIKDPSLNNILPLASIIFEQEDINIMQVSDAHILERLKSLREGNLWQESSKTIKLISL